MLAFMSEFTVLKPPGPASGKLWFTVAVAGLVLCLAFGGWGLWKVLTDHGGADPASRAQAQKVAQLEQQVATLSRSDQITRNANRDLQTTLSERDEEIAGLRADVAFYERFVGATGQRRGLAVHELKVQPQTDQAWHFTATVTQNLNRGAVNVGRLQVSVEGTRAGKLQRLSWAELRQQANAPGIAYSFKYFQQIEGDLMLPPDFQPLRVIAQLQPQGGSAVEQSFTWAAATGKDGAGAASGLN
jgi:hypothetical protein